MGGWEFRTGVENILFACCLCIWAVGVGVGGRG